MLVYPFPSGPLGTRALLLRCPDSGKGAVIDPSSGSLAFVLAKAQELGVAIEKILLTHSHWDHFVDAAALKQQTQAALYVHPLDRANLQNPGCDGIPLFFPVQPVTPDVLLVEGEIVDVGRLQLQVIHTPGHSPGSVCFYLADHHLLIAGDTLFQGGMGNLSLPTACSQDMWESLKKLSALPPQTRVVPGHGQDTTIGQESWIANIAWSKQ